MSLVLSGCLIYEVGVGKGYLEDAMIEDWPKTVAGVKAKYGDTEIIIIPGYGKPGGQELLDYTIKLFTKSK